MNRNRACLCLGIAFALCRVAYVAPFPSYQSKPSTMTGVVSSFPLRTVEETRFTIRTDSGTVLIRGHASEQLSYGDTVTASGRFRWNRNSQYLRSQGIIASIDRAHIEISEEGKGVFRAIFQIRRWLEQQIQHSYHEPQAALLQGLLVGGAGALPKKIVDALRSSGLTHIVAISGYNITLISTFLCMALFWLPRQWRYAPSVVTIIAFTILTGASGSAVRAAIMGVLGLTANQFERIGNMRLTTAWTATMMVLWNPLQLAYDGSFQLSFLALLGVTEVAPILLRVTDRLPDLWGLKENIVLTMSVHLITAPFIAFTFGTFSTLSPLSNLLAPPAVPIATITGAAGVMINQVSPSLGMMTVAVTDTMLRWILGCATWIASLPLSSMTLQCPWWIIAGWYAGCILVVTKCTGAPSHDDQNSVPPSPLPPAHVQEG
jgi:competence protein ComEC